MTIDSYIRTTCLKGLKRGLVDGADDEYYVRLFADLSSKTFNATKKACISAYRANCYNTNAIIKQEMRAVVVNDIN